MIEQTFNANDRLEYAPDEPAQRPHPMDAASNASSATSSDINAGELIAQLRERIASVFYGQPDAVDRLLTCLIARGHALIEDVPGVGKTVLATALARSLGCTFSRIQLTPDLLPADVLGVSVLDRDSNEFNFKRGPIFANIVLADEINRTTPRTQSALLEAMSEAQVSVDGRTMPLDKPFMVVATQNPLSFEGTYPLPEAQLDRFLMRITIGYPDAAVEAQVLDRRPADHDLHTIEAAISAEQLVQLQDQAEHVRMDPALRDYIIALAQATREHEDLVLGLSPRGGLALAAAARATALLGGRDYCIPEDISANIIAVCAHRVLTRETMRTGDLHLSAGVLEMIVQEVPSPA